MYCGQYILNRLELKIPTDKDQENRGEVLRVKDRRESGSGLVDLATASGSASHRFRFGALRIWLAFGHAAMPRNG
jgi:hypothetical protein